MKVKIFQAFGKDEIQNLENEINNWLASNQKIAVIRSDVAAAGGIGSRDGDEYYQTLIICVWYEEQSSKQ